MEVKKVKLISVQEWIPIQKIEKDGMIKLKNKKYIKILKIIPINYDLKSQLEKKSILNSYKIFLKTCNFNIQILIQSNKKDLSKHILKIQKNIHKEQNLFLEKIAKDYINEIQKMNNTKELSSKEFYFIFENEKEIENKRMIKNELKEKYFKIKECLTRCGNRVIEINEKEEILKIIDSFLNTNKYLKNKK